MGMDVNSVDEEEGDCPVFIDREGNILKVSAGVLHLRLLPTVLRGRDCSNPAAILAPASSRGSPWACAVHALWWPTATNQPTARRVFILLT